MSKVGSNNPFWGHHHTEESRARISQSHKGSKNGQWRGDEVGYHALHRWVRRQADKPGLCQRCNERPSLDLANKSGEYKRAIEDWWWLCRKCHMALDGRLVVLARRNRRGWFVSCRYCGEKFWTPPSKGINGRGKFCSKACSNRGRYL